MLTPKRTALLAVALLVTAPVFAQTARSAAPPTAPAPNYDFYALEAAAGGFRTFMSVKGYLPVDPLIDVALPDAHTIVDTGRKIGSASLPYPGETVLSVPGTAAGLGGVPNLPGYPLAVVAQDPSNPEQDLDAGVTHLHAEADALHAAALAAAEDQRGPPASGGSLFTIGSVRAQTRSRELDPDTLEATATSALRDVALLGGQLHIGAVVSTVTSTITAGKVTAATPSVELSGVSFNGQPVAVDDKGVHVGGTASPLSGVDATLRQALAQQGVSIFTTQPQRTVTSNEGSAQGGALVVRMTGTFQNNPVLITYSLGDARVSVKASGQKAALLTPPDLAAAAPAASAPSLAAGPVTFPPLPTAMPSAPGSGAAMNGGGAVVPTRDGPTRRPQGRTTVRADARLAGSTQEFDLVGLYRGLGAMAAVGLVLAAVFRRAVQRRRGGADDELRGLWRW